jgi:chemotaxis protein MotB
VSTGEDTSAQELVIIRRRGGGEEAGHHGGVWKIAYADFMTAMMAFFLVMWLINASDKQTLVQVATYFNPLRLTDRVTSTRGVHNLEAGARGQEENSGPAKDKSGTTVSDKKAEAGAPKQTEEALFKDPYGILSKLAMQAKRFEPDDPARAAPPVKVEIGEELTKGKAYRDPFEPQHRKDSPGKAATEPEPLQAGKPEPAGSAPSASALKSDQAPAPEQAPPALGWGASESADFKRALQAAEEKAAQERVQRAEQVKQAETAERAKMEDEIRQALKQAALGILPNIDITVTEDGLLISVTDRLDFGMFRISSAEPRPELVVVMEKIAKVIGPRSEPLIIRGHTDGRPFKSGSYDNWRLSTARAHMAYHMLVRGGVAEPRFERVEGHADRSLKVGDDPGAAQNRRIEILLRRPRP